MKWPNSLLSLSACDGKLHEKLIFRTPKGLVNKFEKSAVRKIEIFLEKDA